MNFAAFLFAIILPNAFANPFWRTSQDEGEDSHPEEHGSNFEGDIKMTAEQERAMFGKQQTRDTIVGERNLWENRVLPYEVDDALNDRAKEAIMDAMSQIRTRTDGCINFVQRTTQTNFVRFMEGGGCSSFIGRIRQFTDGQDISIGRGCEWEGIVVHEILHALGFFHEQSRLDRDDFITVEFENIQSGFENNFRKYLKGQGETLDVPYDYDSIMHYSGTAFSTDRRLLTIVTKDSGDQSRIGQRRVLSTNDVRQIKLLYNCPASTQAPPAETDAPATMDPEPVTDAPLDGPCTSYTMLDSADRSINSVADVGDYKTDANLEETWYRFTGAAGNQLSRRPPTNQRSCGTFLPGWMYLPTLPSQEESPVQATVCFRFRTNICRVRQTIEVANCGDFLVYKLGRRLRIRSGISYRYCGSP